MILVAENKGHTMQDRLVIEDIVEEILRHAETSFEITESPQAPSFQLMQAYRSSHESECYFGWDTLNLLPSPTKLLAQGTVDKVPMAFEDTTLGHWARFRHYAQRVTVLGCSSTSKTVTYVRILSAFRPHEGAPLLPKLREVAFSVNNKRLDPIRGRKVLTAPTLDHCTMFKCKSAIISSILLRYLGQIPDLRVFRATLAPEAVRALSETPKLFPALRSLQLTISAPSDVTSICGIVSSTDLRHVFIASCNQPTASDIRTWIGFLSQQPRLKHVDVRTTHPVDNACQSREHPPVSTESAYLVTADDLHPLFALPLITTMILRNIPLSLTDDFLEHVAISWPQLRILMIGNGVRFHMTGLTLGGLRPLSTSCPQLRILGATFDMTPPPDKGILQKPTSHTPTTQIDSRPTLAHQTQPITFRKVMSFLRNRLSMRLRQPRSSREEALAILDMPCPNLRQLDISSSTIHDPEYVASFVSEHFPNVRLVSDVYLGRHPARLERVNQMLQERSSGRWAEIDAAARQLFGDHYLG